MAATPTVTAVRPAEFLVLLMAERDAAVPAVTCGDVNVGFVNELHGVYVYRGRIKKRKAPTGGAASLEWRLA